MSGRDPTNIKDSSCRLAGGSGAGDDLVLVVDDDPSFSAALERILHTRGHRVELAASREQARAIGLRHTGAIMAIVDLHLGEQSGIDVIQELRLINPLVRAVLVSAYSSVPSTVRAMRAGAIDCVPKYAGIDAILSAFVAPQTAEQLANSVPSLAQIEWDHIQRVVSDCGGNLTSAALKLRIPRRTLQRKLRRHSPR